MRLIRAFVVILAAAMATALNAATPSSDILPFKATEKTLPNGLKVIVVPTGFPNIVAIYIPVQTGSRNEVEPGKSGFAHFFEHMMFRGTKNVTPEEYERALTKAGARSNAYTTDDYTCYHTTLAKEDLETMLRLEADRFQNLSYSEAAFKTEARAVLGEYNKNSANPTSKIFEAQRDTAFDVHTYKHTTMGFLKDIEEMPNQFAYSKVFFDRWYRPEYTTVIVAGDVDPAKVIPLVEKYWGGWTRGSFKAAIPQEPRAHGPAVRARRLEDADASVGDRRLPRPRVLRDLEGVRRLRPRSSTWRSAGPPISTRSSSKRSRRSTSSSAIAPGSADPPLFTVAARVKKLEDAVTVRDEILRTFAKIRTDRFPDKTVADAISNNRYALARTVRQHRGDREHAGPLRPVRPFVRHAEPALPDGGDRDARRSPRGRAEVRHGRRDGRDDALEGADAGGDGGRSPLSPRSRRPPRPQISPSSRRTPPFPRSS